MNNRLNIYLDKSLSKEANWWAPALATAGTVAAHGAVGHLVQNQISKKLMGHEAQLAQYHNSFLAGTAGHSDLPAKHQVSMGVKRVISPEIGVIHDEVNKVGRHIKEHLDTHGLNWGNLPAHHYDYAQAVVSGDHKAVKELESKHKDVQYIHSAITSKFPQLAHRGEDTEGFMEKFKQSTPGKVLNRIVQRPEGPLPAQAKPLVQKTRKFLGSAAEVGGTAALGYADTGTAIFNGVKRFAGAEVNATKHPFIAKAKEYLQNKLVKNPITNAYNRGAGGRGEKIRTWAQTNIVNPLIGETSSLAKDVGDAKRRG